MTIRNDGEFAEVDGRPAVRFVRTYPHDVETVWEAISTPAGLAHWFPSPDIVFDPTPPEVGGTITMSGDEYSPEGSTGAVLVWEPPHRFGFDWEDDQLFLTVSEHEGGSQLELVNLLSVRGGAARNGAGWDFCLAALEDSLDQPAASDHRSDQEGGVDTFIPVLEQYVAAGLPDDGWRPGGDEPPPTA